MEVGIANLNLEDEKEEPIPYKRDLHKEDEDYQLCLIGKALTDCVIHFSSFKRILAYLWHPLGGAVISDLGDKIYLFRFFYEVDIKRVHNLPYGAILEGMARKLGDFIGHKLGHEEGFCLVRKTIGIQEANFGWDISLRAPTKNELFTRSKWLRDERPNGSQRGNSFNRMEIDRWDREKFDE
ncbi:hypothetical protein Golax_016778 [Gossypium laxum]|uniref:DUF4283 domain-containing protein n=1 Tax=Gossypium laxum TaxID=34288 RepID=A0A7J8YY97_9ROSI|nr:hypothetical protein [Gossypium laxum]